MGLVNRGDGNGASSEELKKMDEKMSEQRSTEVKSAMQPVGMQWSEYLDDDVAA